MNLELSYLISLIVTEVSILFAGITLVPVIAKSRYNKLAVFALLTRGNTSIRDTDAVITPTRRYGGVFLALKRASVKVY